MSKNDEQVQQQQEQTPPQMKPFVEELMKNGKVTLTAQTREELAEMVNEIPAEVKYGAGAVGFNYDTGIFCLHVSLTT